MNTEHEWRQIFTDAGAFWLYQGDPCKDRPHVKLHAGNCSNGFFNGGRVIERPVVLHSVAQQFVDMLGVQGVNDLSEISRVVGPAVGAIPIAQSIAFVIAMEYLRPESKQTRPSQILSGFTEKNEEGRQKLKRFDVKKGDRVLVCEDTVTTGDSVGQTIQCIESAGGVVLPYVLCLCNRSGQTEIGGRKIISIIAPDIKSWEPHNCPYCQVGSKLLYPAKDHWAELTAGEGGGK